MRLLRTIVSALCILTGALSIVGWAVSGIAVDAVEDGTAVVGFTERALTSDDVQDSLAGSVTDEVSAWFAEQGISLEDLGLQDGVQSLLQRLVGTEAFQDTVVEQAERTRQQIAEELTEDSREPGPLVLIVEVDSLVADQLQESPVVGAVAGQMDLAPLELVVMDADSFENARTAYAVMEFLAQFGLWLGIGLIVLGLVISPRRAWFLPKLLLAVGVFSLIAWAALSFMGVDALVAWVPGGSDSAVRAALEGALSEDALPMLIDRTLWVGVGSLVAAAVLAVVVRALSGRR